MGSFVEYSISTPYSSYNSGPTGITTGPDGNLWFTETGAHNIGRLMPCVGNCNHTGSVIVNDILTMVNIALGNADATACPNGIPSGAQVDVALILTAVNNALNGCGG
ncbi:MAG: hypothetical protein ABSA52_22005 [Candidatus Binatia bacterium]